MLLQKSENFYVVCIQNHYWKAHTTYLYFFAITGIAKKVTKFRESWWICLNFLLAALLLLMPRANNYLLESFQDFLIELDMNLVEILIFSKKVPTFLSALLIILVGLMVTLFSEKKAYFHKMHNFFSCPTWSNNLLHTLNAFCARR